MSSSQSAAALSQQLSVVSTELSMASLHPNGRVLSGAFLENSTIKKELLRRLRKVVHVLQDDATVEPDSPDFPGLSSLANSLYDHFLDHRDKEVRLYTVLACVELFVLFAPNAPWSDREVLKIFGQIIRQLANLAHSTKPSPSNNFDLYFRILSVMAEAKIGRLLVDMVQTGVLQHADSDSDSEDDTDNRRFSSSQPQLHDTPAEVLTDFFRTLLSVLHYEHPREVHDKVYDNICNCLQHYDIGKSPPLAVMEEILKVVAKGPLMDIVVPGNDGRPKLEKIPSPAFALVKRLIINNTDRLSTPVSNFLNGVINGESQVVEHCSLNEEEVWTIIYELHNISPSILTTVIGTVSSCLEVTDEKKRARVVRLLGSLFHSEGSKCAVRFRSCFTLWCHRRVDVYQPIRLDLVISLTKVLLRNVDEDVVAEADATLAKIVEHDPEVAIRIEAIVKVCELVFEHGSKARVSPELLQAVGRRVESKFKEERRNALTGLGQIYFHIFLKERLREVERHGDECNISIIQQVLHKNCRFESSRKTKGKKRRSGSIRDERDIDAEKYGWIPSRVFEAAYLKDDEDTDTRSRGILIVDDLLLGSNLKSSRGKSLTPTTRAVGLAMILDSLRNEGDDVLGKSTSNAYNHMVSLFRQRAQLQNAVSRYIDLRSKLRECEKGSEGELMVQNAAMKTLKRVASLSAPLSGGDLEDVLEKLHGAKDKHIFRLLASIATATHSNSARARVLDDLPNRTKSLGGAVSQWVKALIKRCAMGTMLNAEVVQHCTLLALECFGQGDVESCAGLVACVKMAAEVSPSLCSTKETLTTLIELFLECRSVSPNKVVKIEIEEFGLVTALGSILSSVSIVQCEQNEEEHKLDDALRKQLMQLSTRDGTPLQARHAVQTMASLLLPRKANAPMDNEAEHEAFYPLLKELTAPSRMTITSSKDRQSSTIVSLLTALAAFAECAPRVLTGNAKGESAVRFALETVLLGRSHGEDESGHSSDDGEGKEEESASVTPGKKTPTRKSTPSRGNLRHKSPGEGSCILEDPDLDVSCRRACAAIEFMVSYIRSALLASRSKATSGSIEPPPPDRIQKVFELLTQILHDQGLPPSNRDRKTCNSRQDRAALRQCAAIQLLRLCDARLLLERKYLTLKDWEILSTAFLDEERVVRDAVMEEFEKMLKGIGKYTGGEGGPAMAPGLRFVALVTLCCDGEHSGGHSRANGNAANVGPRATATKAAATGCVANLRLTCAHTAALLRAQGRQGESQWEQTLKPLLMPEYMVPYAFHLLSFRRETPSGGTAKVATRTGRTQTQEAEDDEPAAALDDSQNKVLRKRLRWLFDPLWQSLGEDLNNIVFLLRMSETLGKSYLPVPLSCSSEPLLAEAKLKTVCAAAREVLLALVKKDTHLEEYPGEIRVPGFLFKKNEEEKIASPNLTAVAKEKNSAARSRVMFSPDLVRNIGHATPFGCGLSPNLSPITKKESPMEHGEESDEAATLGTTPPSGLRSTGHSALTKVRSPSVKTPSPPSPFSFTSSPNSVFSKVHHKRKNKKRTKGMATKKQKPDEMSPAVTPLGNSENRKTVTSPSW